MKNKLIVIIFIFMNTLSAIWQNVDVYKLRTTDFAIKYINSNDSWSDWSEWEKVNVLVIFDIDKQRIKIFSKETQVYDIATNEGKSKNEDGDVIYSWFCVNEDGNQCRLELWKRFYEDGSFYNQLYVNFSDVRFVYNLHSID